MTKIHTLLISALLAALTLSACKKAPQPEPQAPPPSEQPAPQQSPSPDQPTPSQNQSQPTQFELPDPVATVNGTPISRTEFEKLLSDVFASMGIQMSALPPEQMPLLYRQFAEDLVIDKLIDFASANITISPEEIDKELANIIEQYGSQERLAEELKATNQSLDDFRQRLSKLLRQRKFMAQQAGEIDEVTESEIRSFYEKNKAEFEQPEVVRASHILIRVDESADDATVLSKKKQAEEIAQKARSGEDFAKLAEQFSEDPTAKQNSGDLNYFPRDRMVPEFSEAAFSQEVGSISDPVRTPFGWHIIKVTDKKPAQTLPYDQVKNDIAEYLRESRAQQANNRIIQKLRSEADIQIFIPIPENAPFDARPPEPYAEPQPQADAEPQPQADSETQP